MIPGRNQIIYKTDCSCTIRLQLTAHPIGMFLGSLLHLFWRNNLATFVIKNVIKKIAEHRIKLKKTASRDKTLAMRFLYAINIRFQDCLYLCKLTKDRDNIDDRILNMSDLIQGVRF